MMKKGVPGISAELVVEKVPTRIKADDKSKTPF